MLAAGEWPGSVAHKHCRSACRMRCGLVPATTCCSSTGNATVGPTPALPAPALPPHLPTSPLPHQTPSLSRYPALSVGRCLPCLVTERPRWPTDARERLTVWGTMLKTPVSACA